MWILTGILFFVCESPRAIMPIYHKHNTRTYTSEIINNATYIFTGIDHASNFFIYVMRGEKFREVLFDKISCFGSNRTKPGRIEETSMTSVSVNIT